MAPDASFVLEGFSGNSGTACVVTITDGGLLLEVTGAPVCSTSGGAGLREVQKRVPCTIPPLAPGNYTVFGEPDVNFTLPVASGGEIVSCP